MHYILKPGGYFINFGPLLYHFADLQCEQSIELTYQELMSVLLDRFHFVRIKEIHGLRSGYVSNPRSMLKMEYECNFFVLQKPLESYM